MTKGVTIVLENAAGQKNVIGSKFEDLRQIIDKVEDKSRVFSHNYQLLFI